MRSLDAFIHHENLILFKKQLADSRIDDTQRRQLLRLLAQEEAKEFLHEGRPFKELETPDRLWLRTYECGAQRSERLALRRARGAHALESG